MERGDFEIIPPPEHLRPFVRRYLYANRLLQAGVTFHAKPTGYTYLSNFFGRYGGDRGMMDGRPFERTSRFFFFGQITNHDVSFYHAQSLQLIACELTATAHERLLGIAGERVLGLAAPLDDSAPDIAPVADACFVLGAEAGRDDHVSEANAFFSHLAERALPADPVVERAVTLLEESNGVVRIGEVCAKLDVSPRELNRRFTRIVGVTPKLFGQVLQINWVVGLLYANDTSRLAQIAHEAGFYDQAHFNRAMQRFFREGPLAFLQSNHPAYRSFLAASRRFGSDSATERSE
jgi:AraC-like DNA-binding protein